VLFINHNFEQDIEEMLLHIPKGCECKTINVKYFSDWALKYLHRAIFNGDLEEYYKPEYEKRRKTWARVSKKVLRDLYLLYPFDILIAPSDTFFYLRDVIKASQEMGIPFFVIQKECAISNMGLEQCSYRQGRLFSFISDFMTVCSERHKKYWVNAGSDPNKIVVTGQPRFDFYFRSSYPNLKDCGVSLERSGKIILFFAYEINAYLPQLEDPWKELRDRTFEILVNVAKQHGYILLIKPHPQHPMNDQKYMIEQLRKLSDQEWNRSVFYLNPRTDARVLIINANVVVAFQTTALLEALAAGKKVLYTGWTEIFDATKNLLLPYHLYSDVIQWVKSPEELLNNIINDNGDLSLDKKKRLQIFEEYLGPFDGMASERTWSVIKNFLINKDNLNTIILTDSERKSFLRFEIFISYIFIIFFNFLIFIANITPFLSNKLFIEKIRLRKQRQRHRISECNSFMKGDTKDNVEIIGRINELLIQSAKEKIIYYLIKQKWYNKLRQ